MSLTVVCYRWRPRPGYRSTFGPETVRTLRDMVARHYPDPHRFLCVTDDASDLDADIETVPLWEDFASVPSPHGGKNPSCYRRLRSFHPDIAGVFGERFVTIDLDCVIAGDLRPLWNRPEDIVLWGDTHPTTAYNGSMLLMSAGARPQVWERFDPLTSPAAALKAQCFGSDQGWVSYCLGVGEARWTRDDGVYSFRNDIKPHGITRLPENARIVFFHGNVDPWSDYAQHNCPWVRKHWGTVTRDEVRV
jgi:hypothetical protein